MLDATLHLHGLGGLVAEALNEIFDVGNLFLLIFVGSQLLLTTLGTQLHKLVILDAIIDNLATRDFERAVGHIVDEGTVVAHQHHRTAGACQERFEPSDALNVKVVGGLVKQQDIRTLQEQFGQFETHAPTTRELGRGAVEVGRDEA